MVKHIYECQRCGKEKEVMLNEGEKPEDIMCGCGSKKTVKTGGMFDLLKMSHNDHHDHGGCGCGGACQSN